MLQDRTIVKTLGQFIVRRRKELGISQKDLAEFLKNRDGQPLSLSYYNYLERDRGIPQDYLLDQLAPLLKLSPDVLYFWAKRVPPDLEPDEGTDPKRVEAAFQAFRRELNRGATGNKKTGGRKR
jgi:transcriptional regulator with XRE-family HTH domain